MHYVTATLGLVLVVFALLQIGQPDGLLWASVFASGAFLALITLKRDMPLMLTRFFAVLSSLAMFWFFAGFFRLAPNLHPEWYERAAALDAIGLLFAGFAMITVLSEYSCRMKSDHPLHQTQPKTQPKTQPSRTDSVLPPAATQVPGSSR